MSCQIEVDAEQCRYIFPGLEVLVVRDGDCWIYDTVEGEAVSRKVPLDEAATAVADEFRRYGVEGGHNRVVAPPP